MAMKVMLCDCKSEYQDKKYGIGKRIHNQMKLGSGSRQFRCTICGKTRYE